MRARHSSRHRRQPISHAASTQGPGHVQRQQSEHQHRRIGCRAAAARANASAELVKYESQLSDRVHCASSKTPQGKAKIAEITDKIESIKARVKRAEHAKPPTPAEQAPDATGNTPRHQLRLGHLGTWLDAWA